MAVERKLWAIFSHFTDTQVPKHTKTTSIWPEPQILEADGTKDRLVNSSQEPKLIGRHEHLSQILPTEETSSFISTPSLPSLPQPVKPKSSLPFSSSVSIDPDNILPEDLRVKFRQLLQTYDRIFDPDITGYNGAAGPILASVNIGPVQPPQRKGRVPQYSRNQLVELQAKFDELEQAQVFRRPEDLGITVEYLNPSFLVKKPSGGHRLVTAFADVARYSKPQPSLMPDVDTTLRTIAPWRYMIKTVLTRAFYQIRLSKSSLKYCGVATPSRGIRVYTRSAMGMPGTETVLEEMTCRVLGDFIEEGFVAKLADDLYCGGDSPEALLNNWRRVLQALDRCNLRLSPTKTVICPKTTSVLGWIWSQGRLSANPHRIAVLACVLLLQQWKVFYRRLQSPQSRASQLLKRHRSPGVRSHWPSVFRQTTVGWEPNLQVQIRAGLPIQPQSHSSPSPFRHPLDSYGWIRYQERSRCHMYVSRTSQLHLAGFFSAKLRKHQVTWLPCEVEALSIAASVKHFSPFIIQSPHPTTVLTDSKPCVQAIDKLCRGQAHVWLGSSRPSALTKSIFNTWLGRSTYRLTLPAVTLRTAVSPIARSVTLSKKWRVLSYGTSQFMTSSAASLVSRSQPGQPDDSSNTTVPTFVEYTPTLIKAHARPRSSLIFGMLSAISLLSTLLVTDFLWSSALSSSFLWRKQSLSRGPSWTASLPPFILNSTIRPAISFKCYSNVSSSFWTWIMPSLA